MILLNKFIAIEYISESRLSLYYALYEFKIRNINFNIHWRYDLGSYTCSILKNRELHKKICVNYYLRRLQTCKILNLRPNLSSDIVDRSDILAKKVGQDRYELYISNIGANPIVKIFNSEEINYYTSVIFGRIG